MMSLGRLSCCTQSVLMLYLSVHHLGIFECLELSAWGSEPLNMIDVLAMARALALLFFCVVILVLELLVRQWHWQPAPVAAPGLMLKRPNRHRNSSSMAILLLARSLSFGSSYTTSSPLLTATSAQG